MVLSNFDIEKCVAEGPESALEKHLVAEFLEEKGYRWGHLDHLPAELVKELMQGACRYASLKLAEIEAKRLFREHIRPPT
jgi:hypothetical protein